MSIIEKVKRIRRKSINPKGTEYVRCPHCDGLYKHNSVLVHLRNVHDDEGWK